MAVKKPFSRSNLIFAQRQCSIGLRVSLTSLAGEHGLVIEKRYEAKVTGR